MAESNHAEEEEEEEEETVTEHESYAAEEEEAFQKERYMYAMGQEERRAQEEKVEQQRQLQEREKQAEMRKELRRKEEEERLLALGKRNVLVVTWDGFDGMTAVSVIDVLRAADVNVVIAAVSSYGLGKGCSPTNITKGRHGVSLVADVAFETTCNSNFHLFNAIVVPGGDNMDVLCAHTKLLSLIKTLSSKEKFICGAAETPYLLFARCGLVKARAVTGHPAAKAQVRLDTCKQHVDEPIHIDYNVVTCRSAADAIEFGLNIVKCIFADEGAAVLVAEKLGHTSFVEKVTARKAEERKQQEQSEGERQEAPEQCDN